MPRQPDRTPSTDLTGPNAAAGADPAAGPAGRSTDRPTERDAAPSGLCRPAEAAEDCGPAGASGPDPQAAEDATAIERAQRLTDVVTRLRRALRSSIRTDYPWESLPMAQVELLQTLAAAPLRVGELAARQRLAPNTVSGLVGKLLEAGFVDRQADPGDRRTARIALTAAGHQQLEDWRRAHERRIAGALGTLSRADHDAIMAALPGLDHLARALAGGSGNGTAAGGSAGVAGMAGAADPAGPASAANPAGPAGPATDRSPAENAPAAEPGPRA